MPKLVINIEDHSQKFTVSQMRKRLAQVLSKLNGDQEVSFNFVATLENYQPNLVLDIYDAFAINHGVLRSTAKSRVLGMGYTFGQPQPVDPYATFAAEHMTRCLHPYGFDDGICHSCMLSAADAASPATVFGELARPENE